MSPPIQLPCEQTVMLRHVLGLLRNDIQTHYCYTQVHFRLPGIYIAFVRAVVPVGCFYVATIECLLRPRHKRRCFLIAELQCIVDMWRAQQKKQHEVGFYSATHRPMHRALYTWRVVRTFAIFCHSNSRSSGSSSIFVYFDVVRRNVNSYTIVLVRRR